MRSVFITAALLLCIATATAQWQIQNPLPHTEKIAAIHTFDSLTALAVGNFPWVMRTSDGGESWNYTPTLSAPGMTFRFNNFYFSDNSTGWTVGSRFSILKTTDQGLSWYKIPNIPPSSSPATGTWNDITFTDSLHGWVVGSQGYQDRTRFSFPGRIIRTTDGGISWQEATPPDTIWELRSVSFINNLQGWAVGDGGTLLQTSDGGLTWKSRQIGEAETTLLLVKAFSPSHIIATGYSNKLFRSEDGGEHWTEERTPITIANMVFTDSLQGWGVGDPGASYVKTNDGGKSWTETPLDPSAVGSTNYTLYGISRTPSGSIWAAGDLGIIYRSGSDVDAPWRGPGTTAIDILSVWFTSDLNGWAAGLKGTLLRTSDGGKRWNRFYDNVLVPTFDNLFFADSLYGWHRALGFNDIRLMATTDGGNEWKSIFTDSTLRLNLIRFLNRTRGFAVAADAGSPALYRTDDGGRTWKYDLQFSTTEQPVGMRFLDEHQGWIVGSRGLFLHTVDGGENWTEKDAFTRLTLRDVAFTDSLYGWVVGDSNSIFHTTNGGQTWNRQQDTSTHKARFLRVAFSDRNRGYIVGDFTLLHTEDGGANWRYDTLSPINSILALINLHVNPSGKAWAVGQHGSIFHYSPSMSSVPRPHWPDVADAPLYVAPNPATTEAVVEIPSTEEDRQGILTIFSALGQQIRSIRTAGSRVTLNMDGFPSGIYHLRWEDGRQIRIGQLIRVVGK